MEAGALEALGDQFVEFDHARYGVLTEKGRRTPQAARTQMPRVLRPLPIAPAAAWTYRRWCPPWAGCANAESVLSS